MNQQFKDYLDMVERMKETNRIHCKNYRQGYFVEFKNPLKCDNVLENHIVTYRSQWEYDFMKWLDSTDAVVRWSSEMYRILYKNLVKGKTSFYIPDFYLEYLSKDGSYHKEMIEVKPRSQAVLKETSNGYDKIQYCINLCKWEAAIKFCQKRGWQFRVLTQQDLYRA